MLRAEAEQGDAHAGDRRMGPTGHFIVNGLRRRGFRMAMLHTGRHELPEIPADVEHIHTDPFDAEALAATLGGPIRPRHLPAPSRLLATS